MSGNSNGISSLRTVRTFLKVGSCSETACNVLNRAYNHPMEREEQASMPFAGGIMQHGYQCGLLWGAALAAGAEAYGRIGTGPKAEAAAVSAAQKLAESFHGRFKEINCLELIDTDWHKTAQVLRFFIKGGTFRCFGMAAKFARMAYAEIERTFADEAAPSPEPPVSCAAELAKKMGASDMHAVMAAGFAGGIGLSGSACGALGAAIWLTTMKRGENGDGKIDYKDPEALALIEKFLEHADYRFECEEIVGRKFENPADHAEHLRCGGCAGLIEALAEG